MPDPDQNTAPVLAIDAIQEACANARARLRHMPEGPDLDEKAAVFVLASGQVVEIPVKQLRTDKNRESAVASLTARLRNDKPAKGEK